MQVGSTFNPGKLCQKKMDPSATNDFLRTFLKARAKLVLISLEIPNRQPKQVLKITREDIESG
jgi:hypothetical protein